VHIICSPTNYGTVHTFLGETVKIVDGVAYAENATGVQATSQESSQGELLLDGTDSLGLVTSVA
jgi:hypothetical protein